MSATLAERPTLMFDLDAPRARAAQPARPGGTLDELILGNWGDLLAHRTVVCPVCAGALAPRYGAGPSQVGGRCRDCDATLG